MTLSEFQQLARQAGVPEDLMPEVDLIFHEMDGKSRTFRNTTPWKFWGNVHKEILGDPRYFLKIVQHRKEIRIATDRQVILSRCQPLRDSASKETRALRREVAVMKHRLRKA